MIILGFSDSFLIAAICLLLLSLAALATPETHRAWRILAHAAIALAVLLILSRFWEIWPQIRDRVSQLGHPASPQPGSVGSPMFWMTEAVSLLLLAIGQLLLQYRRTGTAQILLSLAAIGFLLEVTGYASLLPTFHHTNGLVLGLAGSILVAAVMASVSGSGFIHALLMETPHARTAQTALVSSTLGALIVGCGLTRFGASHDGLLVLAEALLFMAWTWIMITASTMHVNELDRQRRRGEAQLLREATIDRLTGLLSRNKMDELIAEQRRAPARAAMIVIDIDRFRFANNALGNDAGDLLLMEAARRLSNLAAPHPVARAGGDKFAIFCGNVSAAEANRLGQAVVDTVAVPFILADGRLFHLTASVGVAHGATEGINDLRDAADEAMYIAKNKGGNQSVLFISALRQARTERIGLEQDLHRAFKSSSELFLVYQPIISLRDRRLVGVEALARWQHPQAGLVAPGRFVAIAESAGMFLGLGGKLRELAVAQAAQWRDKGLDPLPVINLNVSPLELAGADVPGTLGALIDRYGLRRDGFCLEVTEGSFADERALQSLQMARDAGFKIAMDDFGVGYSSLTQLPRLPLTTVKLDRSFLDQATESEDGISLLATMIQLAHVLKLPVVAEGVETTEELSIVSDCGCDAVQGFIFSRALTPAQLEPWLRGDYKAQPRPPQTRAEAAVRPAEGRRTSNAAG